MRVLFPETFAHAPRGKASLLVIFSAVRTPKISEVPLIPLFTEGYTVASRCFAFDYLGHIMGSHSQRERERARAEYLDLENSQANMLKN